MSLMAVVLCAALCKTASVLPTVQVTNMPSFETKPAFSSDGSKIAFESNGDGNWDLYIANADGSGLRQLTSGPAAEGNPVWVPGEARIAFQRYEPATRKFFLRGMDSDGSSDGPLVGTAELEGFRPIYSRDRTRIAFDRPVDVGGRSTHQVFAMNADGTDLRRLTSTASYEAAPSWSPDGKHLVFFSQRDDPNTDFREATSEIYVMDADGGAQARLTWLGVHSEYPSWSPSSEWIAFEADVGGNVDIYLMRSDGRDQPVNVTTHSAKDSGAAWSPDGRSVIFSSNRGGDFDLYVVDVSSIVTK